MAHSVHFQSFNCFFNHKCLAKSNIMEKNIIPRKLPLRWKNIECSATKQHNPRPVAASYQPSSWSYEFIESLGSQNYHMMDMEEEEMKKMEEEIRCMLDNDEGQGEPLILLELIDDIDRLGMGYRFRESTNRALERMLIQSSLVMHKMHKNLYGCALFFRLLRQHGFHVSPEDIFGSFKDPDGNFTASLAKDIEGMLSLYEASHLAYDGETTLEEAREFTSFHLKNMIGNMDTKSAIRVSHALELPFHHRMQRLEARWNIELMYDNYKPKNQILLKLATLDFNMVQSVYQRELQEVSRWWRNVGLANKLSFARDRLMESFFWAVGMVSEPQFSKSRIGLTKVVKLITVLDDIYDVYGSPEELEQLTDAVDKWDVNAVDHLPDYLKICFFALYNTVNEMAYDTLKEHGQLIISQLRKGWADLCKAFLREAQWNYRKHIPKFDEYLDHGWVSSSGVVLLNHAYFLLSPNITKEAIENLNNGHALLRFPCTIFRLANDLCSAKEDIETGELAKAVPSYMHQTGSSIEVAGAHMRKLIDQSWKMMNKEMTNNNDSHFDKSFIQTAANLARIALCQYQYGDAHSTPTDVSRNRVTSVIINPIHKLDAYEYSLS